MPLRLLRTWTPEPELEEVDERTKPEFGILSHRWKRGHEVSLDELTRGLAKEKDGWKKIEQSRALALSEGLRYVWIDTCCIDKTSSTELAEALNSMFRWYSKARRCYAYLSDVEDEPLAIDYEVWRAAHPDHPEEPSVGLEIAIVPSEQKQSLSTPLPSEPTTTTTSTTTTTTPQTNIIDETPNQAFVTPPEENANDEKPLPTLPDPSESSRPESTTLVKETTSEDDQAHNNDDERDSELGLPEKTQTRVIVNNLPTWQRFCVSEWFKRGWTLQEMIAPAELVFYNAEWKRIGNFKSVIAPGVQIADYVSAVTGVDKSLLFGERTLQSYSIAQKMSWAANRETEREEDRSYSLLGIFDVSLTVIYGEGRRAFQRLQEELLRTTSDPTIFAWQQRKRKHKKKKGQSHASQARSNLLAAGPEAFRECGNMVPLAIEQRMFQVIGGVVQFETRADENYAVLCASGDPSHVITLRLIGKGNQFFAAGTDRTRPMDIYHAARNLKKRTVNVWRDYDQASKKADKLETILCRSTSEKVSFMSTSSGWNSKSQSFEITDDEFSGEVHFYIGSHRTDFKIWSTKRAKNVLDTGLSNNNVHFEYSLLDFVLSAPLRLISSTSIVSWGSLLHATVREQQLFDRQLTLVEIEVYPFWRFLLPYIGLILLGLLRGLWLLLRLLTFPLAIVIPIVTIYMLRLSAGVPGLETTEIIGLAVGVPLTLLTTGYYYYSSENREFIDDSKLIEGARANGVRVFNITSIVLCSILLRSLQSRDSHTNTSSEGIALIVRISLCAFILTTSVLRTPFYRFVISVLRLGSTLGIALPLMLLITASEDSVQERFAPIMSGTCVVASKRYAGAGNGDAYQNCLTLSYEARLTWSIIALSLWESFWALMPGLRRMLFTLPSNVLSNRIHERREKAYDLF